MTILYCLSDIKKSHQWLWFAEEMKNRGINQIYIHIEKSEGSRNFFYDDLVKLEVMVYSLPHKGKLSYLKNILQTRAIIKKYKPDIIHTSLPLGNMVGQIAAWLSGKKNRVTTCENASWAHDFNSGKQKLVDKLTYRLSKKVIAVADTAKEYLKDNYHLDDKKLLSIYHGLKESEYENISEERITKLRQALEIRKDDFIVGVISRYEFWKGHEYIIKAAAVLKARNQYAGIKILVFGSKGSYSETAMQQMKEQKVEDILMYKGFIDDPVALFQVFDVHLHVPVNKYVENCGINIIEGMISARPQILTRSGYAWQSAEHMKNAYVVDYKNAEAIADAILYLKNHMDEGERLALQAKADAIKTYGLNVKVDKHIALYNELLK
ncbi:MAG TPA: glycosyltransferase family 4 protein [Chitinophagaceae bacterium]|nr:glycosyltransferase family 4 protein [Chitinophagaceae bacterium]